MFNSFRQDVAAVLARDPAARSSLEVALLYPGLHAVWGHRITHWLWVRGWRLPARWLSQMVRGMTGIEIHPGAVLGPGFFIDHGMGVVIGETAEVGADVTLYHGVTLGGTSLNKGKRHPTIGDRVVVGAGAKVLGAIEIGADSRIGANAVVVRPVPPNSVVVGVPGQVVVRTQRQTNVDLNHTNLPDTLGTAVAQLLERVEELEHKIAVQHAYGATHQVHAPLGGVWRGDDFQI
ncbi:MAG TPA: serine O-acetyltransferase [Anaerolineales bacterium]|nr:serine O-acetyltransferase [Anaerolineales bacterium]